MNCFPTGPAVTGKGGKSSSRGKKKRKKGGQRDQKWVAPEEKEGRQLFFETYACRKKKKQGARLSPFWGKRELDCPPCPIAVFTLGKEKKKLDKKKITFVPRRTRAAEGRGRKNQTCWEKNCGYNADSTTRRRGRKKKKKKNLGTHHGTKE